MFLYRGFAYPVAPGDEKKSRYEWKSPEPEQPPPILGPDGLVIRVAQKQARTTRRIGFRPPVKEQ